MASTTTVNGLPDDHFRVTYEDIHCSIRDSAQLIRDQFDPDIIIAIGSGGYFPSRVLRCFLQKPSVQGGSKTRSVPIQAIGLALYEEVAGTTAQTMGREVIRTQWLDEKMFTLPTTTNPNTLLGKNIIFVDDIDDSRSTLQYAYQELKKDIENAYLNLSESEKKSLPPTRFATYVIHNKVKPQGKKGSLPLIQGQNQSSKLDSQPVQDGIGQGVWYYTAAGDIQDVWVEYPWEVEDIVQHNKWAQLAKDQQQQA
ncbi:unnamed protein product [Sympodiomycopsis kandeliae]